MHMQKSKNNIQNCQKNLNIVSSFYKTHPKLDKIDVYFTLINNSQNSRYETVLDSSQFQNSHLGVEILNFCNTMVT